jgi:hypothetical protein
MNEQDMERRLNDYVDGLLSEDEARAFEKELEATPELRKAEAQLRNLQAAVRNLPEGIQPGRDLWGGVQARLQPKPIMVHPRRAAPAWLFRLALPVAATVLVVAGASIVLRHMATRAVLPATVWERPGADLGIQLISAELAPIESEYRQTTASLREQLEASKQFLAPETVQVIDENLAMIDKAVEEIHTALKKDPGNQRLVHTLIATYDKEVELLERAVRLPDAV